MTKSISAVEGVEYAEITRGAPETDAESSEKPAYAIVLIPRPSKDLNDPLVY